MRFKQYLTELFKEKKDFKVKVERRDMFKARFSVDSVPYLFSAYLEGENDYMITFEDTTQPQDKEMEITGMAKEDALKVYAYVISIIKYFLRSYQPNEVEIEGFEPRQFQLYNKLVKRFNNEIEKMGYSIKYRGDLIYLVKKEQ